MARSAAKPAKNKKRRGAGKNEHGPAPFAWGRRWLKRVVLWLIAGAAVVMLIPLVLVPLYLVVDPASTLMVSRTVTGQRVEREWRDLDEISDRLKVAVTMSEDGQFCRHHGVDLGALRAEVQSFLRGEEARGASTITMQVARNLFLWQGRSLVRKGLEVPLAFYIDLVMPKRRIMEIYLNIAEWGPDGEFGIEAGVQRAFGQDADALRWEQAALMTVMLPNPRLRDAAAPSPGLRRVAGIIEQRAKTYWERTLCLFDGQTPAL